MKECQSLFINFITAVRFIFTVALILATLAFITNGMFLVTVLKHASLRQKSLSIYLVILSCLDVCLSLSYACISIRWLIHHMHGVDRNVVMELFKIRFPLHFVSCWLVVAIYVERHNAICRPVYAATSRPNFCLLYGALVVFVLVSLAISGVSVVKIFTPFEPVTDKCKHLKDFYPLWNPDTDLRISEGEAVPLISYYLLGTDIITVTILICLSRSIFRSLNLAGNFARRGGIRYYGEQRNLTKMVFVNTSVFCVCVLVQDIFWWFFINFDFTIDQYGITNLFLVTLLTLLNSGANPIIYNVFGSLYRNALVQTFAWLHPVTVWRRLAKLFRGSIQFSPSNSSSSVAQVRNIEIYYMIYESSV